MLSKLSIGAKLAFSFGIVFLFLLVTAAAGLGGVWKIKAEMDDLVQSVMSGISQTLELEEASLKHAVLVRDLLINGNDAASRKIFFDRYSGSEKQIAEKMARLAASVATRQDDSDKEKVAQIGVQASGITKEYAQIADLIRTGKIDEARSHLAELAGEQHEFDERIEEFFADQVKDLGTAKERVDRLSNALLGAVVLSVVLGLTIGGGVLYGIGRGVIAPIREASRLAGAIAAGNLAVRLPVRSNDEIATLGRSLNEMSDGLGLMIRKIRDEADQVAQFAAELADSASTVDERSKLQRLRVIQVGEDMEQMSHATLEVSTGANAVKSAAEQTRALSDQGNQHMAQNRISLEAMVKTADASAQKVESLSGNVNEISAISRLIREIADQTNLLALNAAIEAARAGEHGRGFAVVADEVRKLAERTTSSTAAIAATIGNINSNTEQVVESMAMVRGDVDGTLLISSGVTAKLIEILEASSQVSAFASRIAATADQQSSAGRKTTDAMTEMASIAEENTLAVQHVTATAKAMAQTADDLLGLVQKFKLTA